MKESIGSTVLLYVFLILFVIVLSIMAVTINFALTFQKKNQIISILEKTDGNLSTAETKLADLDCVKVENLNNKYQNHKCKYAEKNTTGENIKGKYYQVVVFVEFSVPIVNKTIYFPINGETSVVGVDSTTTVPKPQINN